MKTNQEKPLVSVIVTTFNRKELLAETIRSILAQTYKNLEFIIVDDGSEDNTKEIVSAFGDPRMNYIYCKNWGGPARPRNIGIGQAKGEYLAFCDDDDLWHPNKIEEQLLQFDKNVIAVSTNAGIIGQPARFKHNHMKHDIFLKAGCDIGLLKSTVFSSLMIRKNVGVLFDERESFKFVEDFAFMVKLMYETQGAIKLLAKPLTYYRFHSGNNGVSIKSAKNSINVVREYSAYLSDKQLKEAYRKCLLLVARRGLNAQSPESKRYFLEALKYSAFLSKPKICLMALISSFPPKLQQFIMGTYRLFTGRGADS